jgi:hypothetical protein
LRHLQIGENLEGYPRIETHSFSDICINGFEVAENQIRKHARHSGRLATAEETSHKRIVLREHFAEDLNISASLIYDTESARVN